MSEIISRMLSSDPDVSSKRIVTSVAALAVILIALVDLFTEYTITEYVFEGIVWIAMAGLGSIAVENFGNRKTNKIQEEPVPIENNNTPEI